MSGHSHWHNIQQKKGKLDQKKGTIFTKMSQQIMLAVREGGADPAQNFSLKVAIDSAKAVNMPKESIDRVVTKASGGGEGTQLTKVLYEGFGPFSVPVIIDAITDNKNRTVSELRLIFSQNNGIFGESGSVSWQFNEVGLIEVKCAKLQKSEKFGVPDNEIDIPPEEVQLDIMEIPSIRDIELSEGEDKICYVTTDMTALAQMTQAIKEKGYVILSSSQYFAHQNPIVLTKEQQEKVKDFISLIDDNPDVQKVWSALS